MAGLISWLGKVQADRLLESEKSRHAEELERLRASLAIAGEREDRLSKAAFDLYSSLWTQLQDVRSAADALWERADLGNLESFRSALRAARIAVERGRLILDEHHYSRLRHLIGVFGDYEVGKVHLISITSRDALKKAVALVGGVGVAAQIHLNDRQRQEYGALLDEILPRFKRKLGLASTL